MAKVEFIPRSVYEERAERIRQYLAAQGLDALVIFNPDNLNYVSGFMPDVAPWERAIACIIPRDGTPELILNELSTNHIKIAVARGRCWIENVRIWSEHPRQAGRLPLRPQWGTLLGHVLLGMGATRAVGVDGAVPSQAEVRVIVPKIEFVPAGDFIRDMRLVKHADELALIRAGATITDRTQEFYQSQIRPGRLLCDIDGLAAHFMATTAAEEFPGARIEPRVIGFCGPESACPHGPGGNSDMRLAAGQSLINIVIIRVNGYVTENERTYFVGEPDDTLAEAFDVMCAAQSAAIDTMRLPNRVCDFDAAAQAVIEGAGFGAHINHRTGHGIGLAGHEYPDDTAFNYRPLAPGMVFSAEPGLYFPDHGGVRHDDTVFVTDGAPEVVTQFPKDRQSLTVRI
jgi:Xaa-Pro aminopeptidase